MSPTRHLPRRGSQAGAWPPGRSQRVARRRSHCPARSRSRTRAGRSRYTPSRSPVPRPRACRPSARRSVEMSLADFPQIRLVGGRDCISADARSTWSRIRGATGRLLHVQERHHLVGLVRLRDQEMRREGRVLAAPDVRATSAGVSPRRGGTSKSDHSATQTAGLRRLDAP